MDIPDMKNHLCLLSPFLRPSWDMTRSKQPRNCYITSKALSMAVKNLHKQFIICCQENNAYYFDIYGYFKEQDFEQGDIHLNYRGKHKFRELMMKKTF